jgi:tRNA(fMet)-specific endonuclease VapC
VNYLVDSDWVIDGIAKIGSAQATLDELMKDGVAVSIVTLGEVFEGAFSSVDPQVELALFRRYFLAFAVVPLTDPVMETFARVRAGLRRQGRLIPDTDLQIAATAVTLDLTLVTRNLRHFSRVPGLKIYDPATTT